MDIGEWIPFLLSPRLRWLAIVAILALAVFVLLRSRTPSPPPSPLPPLPSAATATATVELPIYSEAIAGRPRNINPLFSDFNDADQDLCALIFSGLTLNDANGEARPALAQSWDVSEDGLIYTFMLRQDVKWHDGTPFTARDVFATISLIQSVGFQGPPALVDIWRHVNIQVNGDYTVTFLLNEPYAPFLSYTSLGILPAHVIEKIQQWPDAAFNAHPIGTGPFRVRQIDQARGLVTLEPFPDYYGPKPKLGRVDLHFYPTELAALAAYQKGEVLGVARVPADKLAEARKLEGLTLYATPMSGFNALYLNLRNPLFQQKEVRQALLLALDRQRIIDRALDGQGLVAHAPLLPNNWAYNRFVRKYTQDAEAARALLAQAGWRDANGDGVLEKGGAKLEFAIMAADNPTHIHVIEEITREWAAVGVKANPQVTGFSGLARDFLRPRKFDAIYIEWRDPSSDPDLYSLWHSTRISDEGQNYASWQNRDADELLEDARRTTDPDRRAQLYARFQDLFADQVPAILIGYPIYVYAVDKRVQNVQLGPLTRAADRFRTMANWTIDGKLAASAPIPTPTR